MGRCCISLYETLQEEQAVSYWCPKNTTYELAMFGQSWMFFVSIHEPSLDFYSEAQDNGAAIVR